MSLVSEKGVDLRVDTARTSAYATPEENLALDEELLGAVEDDAGAETLRFWESDTWFVAVGKSQRIDQVVLSEADVPVLRRGSGGGAVLIGPGCLNFALALSLRRRPELRDVRRSFAIILGSIAEGLRIEGMAIRGTSDLAIGDRKVSGNAQRRTRNALLHHGTLLYDFCAERVARVLKEPERQPDYRAGRTHAEFLGTIPLSAADLKLRIGAAVTWPYEPGLARSGCFLDRDRYGSLSGNGFAVARSSSD